MSGRTFTLIEVAAAAVILALLVVPLLGARNRTTASAVGSARKSAATQLAASKLSELAVKPLSEIERTGSFEEIPGGTWEFSVEREDEFSAIPLYKVKLVVSYGETRAGDSRDEIAVSTLVIDREQES